MNNLAFGKQNYLLTAVGMAIVILGFILMSGSGTTEEAFDPNIFSPLRIRVAPAICVVGYVLIIVAIMWRGKADKKHEA